jgi:hypothetical protein
MKMYNRPDYGPLPAGVTESQMMDKMLRPADHAVSIEQARRRKIDQERRDKLKAENEAGAIKKPMGINTGAYQNINMVHAPSPINTARPIKYNPNQGLWAGGVDIKPYKIEPALSGEMQPR